MIKILKWTAAIYLLISGFKDFAAGNQSLAIFEGGVGVFYIYSLLTGKT
ncbi:hypothetical protein [Selenihalanaerobacter shriftii]|uniref:Uncharacterized protein n=1 Tax=Selenihalanaerobacter shriftii TaxID=142842 RepID=A0A1T4QUG4_9FIRM|nr:hypothetical protein [Selenihalanaerobacter shriftii]SKA06918.1 hypothetical protein SAMN02745118_02688 [Selenihalanaerobacter shriftii]